MKSRERESKQEWNCFLSSNFDFLIDASSNSAESDSGMNTDAYFTNDSDDEIDIDNVSKRANESEMSASGISKDNDINFSSQSVTPTYNSQYFLDLIHF